MKTPTKMILLATLLLGAVAGLLVSSRRANAQTADGTSLKGAYAINSKILEQVFTGAEGTCPTLGDAGVPLYNSAYPVGVAPYVQVSLTAATLVDGGAQAFFSNVGIIKACKMAGDTGLWSRDFADDQTFTGWSPDGGGGSTDENLLNDMAGATFAPKAINVVTPGDRIAFIASSLASIGDGGFTVRTAVTYHQVGNSTPP
jgi:hypothetical protein